MAWSEKPSALPRTAKKAPRWVLWIVSVVPVLFILLGLGMVAEAVLFVSGAQSTRGQVVEIRRSYDDGSVSYTPTIRYSRSDGQTFEAETHISSGSYDFDLGTQVDILYAFDDPDEVRINSFFSLYGIGLIFAVIGGVFLRIITWVRRKSKDRATRDGVAARSASRFAALLRKELHLKQDQEQADLHAEPAAANGDGDGDGDTGADTDPSKRGHAHEPKPNQTPTVRRMR